MSYTVSAAEATCTVPPLADTRAAALAVHDYCVNHPDEIPCDLDECDSDEFVLRIEEYLHLDGDKLLISYHTEESNGDSEVFDFLSHHFACLQTSPYQRVNWSIWDSKSGQSGGTNYYDRQGRLIDIEAILQSALS